MLTYSNFDDLILIMLIYYNFDIMLNYSNFDELILNMLIYSNFDDLILIMLRAMSKKTKGADGRKDGNYEALLDLTAPKVAAGKNHIFVRM